MQKMVPFPIVMAIIIFFGIWIFESFLSMNIWIKIPIAVIEITLIVWGLKMRRDDSSKK